MLAIGPGQQQVSMNGVDQSRYWDQMLKDPDAYPQELLQGIGDRSNAGGVSEALLSIRRRTSTNSVDQSQYWNQLPKNPDQESPPGSPDSSVMFDASDILETPLSIRRQASMDSVDQSQYWHQLPKDPDVYYQETPPGSPESSVVFEASADSDACWSSRRASFAQSAPVSPVRPQSSISYGFPVHTDLDRIRNLIPV
jgi:hypothetical protein